MTTYNTGNPIGSTAVKDLYDNAENLDVLVNDKSKLSHPDRLGVPRKTWYGMEQDFQRFLLNSGYQNIGDYGPGLEITARNQIFWRDGELYRAGAVLELPYTTTGDWGDEEGLFVAVGDAALRQELADPSEGAGIVAYQPPAGSPTTVAAALGAIATSAENNAANNAQAIDKVRNDVSGTNLTPLVVDMHFGTLRGVGWLGDAVELGGHSPVPATVSSGVSVGSNAVSVSNPGIFREGQLIAYKAVDQQWRSARIEKITASTLTLDHNIPVEIPTGAEIVYFYANDAHPNIYGYKVIADDALRQLKTRTEREYLGRGYKVWSKYNNSTVTGATLHLGGVNDYLLPGSSAVAIRTAKVDTPSIGDGAISDPVTLQGGDYITSLVINPGERTGGYTGGVRVSIEEVTRTGHSFIIATRDVGPWRGVRTIRIRYTVSPGSAVRVVVANTVGGPAVTYIGQVAHDRVIESLTDLNHGRHVLFGDSWFSGAAILDRLQERLPNATFIGEGIGGNRASQLLDRYFSDVQPHSADFVWVMCGTNDYYAGVAPSLFEQQLNQLAGYIASDGAQLISFTPSVGDATYAPTGEKLTVSRDYANLVNYHATAPSAMMAGAPNRTASVYNAEVTVNAGSSKVIAAFPGTTTTSAIMRYIFSSDPNLTLRVGYTDALSDTNGTDQTHLSGGTEYTDILLPRASGDTARKFVVVAGTNRTGSPISTDIVADLAWRQD